MAVSGYPADAKNRQFPYNILHTIVKRRYLLILALPGVVWMLVFVYAPMYGLVMAFTDYSLGKPILGAPWAGLRYFREFFDNEYFWVTIQNTLGISLLKLAVAFPFTIVFAMFLNEIINARFKKMIQTITYLPHFLSWAVLGAIVIIWLSEMGPVNDILANKLGLMKAPYPFLAKPNSFWPMVLSTEMWKETGWNAIIFLAAISGINPEYYEAAYLDGASRFQRMWHITLPSIAYIISLMFILNVGYLMNSNFDQILVLANQLNFRKSLTLDLYVYRSGIVSGRFSYSTAIGLFKSLVALVLLVIANETTKKISGKSMF
jgi:putative aldouronate transport system permease protein